MTLKKSHWLIALGLVLFLSGVAFSTPKWWKVDSKLVFTEIEGLTAVDSLHVWAAAHPGAYVIRSTDGGWNWSQTFSGYPYYIDFVDTLKGWGVIPGDPNGAIVRTTDGGQHWSIQNSTPGMSLYNLEFVDPLHGVVVGDSGFALFTSNGGINWRRSNLPISRSIMQAARVLDTGHVWVGGYGGVRDTSVVFFSSDWGQSWQPQPLLDIITETNVVTIDFLDTLNGYLFSRWGSGSASFLYRTSNGGTTWNKILSINSDDWGLRDMDATDTLHIWLAGNYFPGEAAILSTSDGGTTWDTTLTGIAGPFYNVEMFSSHRG